MFVSQVTKIGLDIFKGIGTLLWPCRCVCCNVLTAEDSGGLCSECWSRMLECTGDDYCPYCGRQASLYGRIEGRCGGCQGQELILDGIARGGVYSGSLRDLILAFKFHDRTELHDIISLPASAALEGSSFSGKIDYLVPVPLHWRRRLWRGYNQSHLICKSLKFPGVPINTDLVRTRYTKRQWKLTTEGRRRNVKGAFATRKGHDFTGKNICLVDDIATSGATLYECAKVLKASHAAKVYALVVASAIHNED